MTSELLMDIFLDLECIYDHICSCAYLEYSKLILKKILIFYSEYVDVLSHLNLKIFKNYIK